MSQGAGGAGPVDENFDLPLVEPAVEQDPPEEMFDAPLPAPVPVPAPAPAVVPAPPPAPADALDGQEEFPSPAEPEEPAAREDHGGDRDELVRELQEGLALVRAHTEQALGELRAELHAQLGDLHLGLPDLRAQLGDLRRQLAELRGALDTLEERTTPAEGAQAAPAIAAEAEPELLAQWQGMQEQWDQWRKQVIAQLARWHEGLAAQLTYLVGAVELIRTEQAGPPAVELPESALERLAMAVRVETRESLRPLRAAVKELQEVTPSEAAPPDEDLHALVAAVREEIARLRRRIPVNLASQPLRLDDSQLARIAEAVRGAQGRPTGRPASQLDWAPDPDEEPAPPPAPSDERPRSAWRRPQPPRRPAGTEPIRPER